MADANAVSQVVVRGAQGARSAASKAGHGGSAFDIWTRTEEGQAGAAGQTTGLLNMPVAPVEGGTSAGALPTAMGQQVDALKQAAADLGKAKGALATAGAAMGALTTLEQAISTPLSAIPFPAYPAIRVMDMDVGLPHAHNHPPNLVPPAPPVPLPSTGPVIPIPYVSGAATVLINGMPAGRCGDMGMGIWCGSYFPMYEIFLGSSSVWIEGMRAARLGVDITKHCIFSVPKPNDPPLGPMIGMTISSSANVVIGGVPMPSLTNMAVGAAMKTVFKGIGKILKATRAAKAAKAAKTMRVVDDLVPMFNKGEEIPTKSRPQALAEVLEEMSAKNVELRIDEEAQEYLDYCARMSGADPKDFHAVTLGEDLIMMRPEYADNPRILREELIHTDQAKAGKVNSSSIVENEIEARELMIKNADRWGITPEEVAEMQREIEQMNRTGVY